MSPEVFLIYRFFRFSLLLIAFVKRAQKYSNVYVFSLFYYNYNLFINHKLSKINTSTFTGRQVIKGRQGVTEDERKLREGK